MTRIAKMPSGRARGSAPALVYRVNIAQSCALLEEHIKTYNQTAKTKIKAVHFALAKKLIELYARRFADWQQKNNYSFNPDTPLPLLSVNNESLAEWLVCTDRTVRNYRARLAEIQFITETVWHGTSRPYEVRLNPAFLWLACNVHTERVLLPHSRFFPLTGSGYPKQEQTGTVCGKKREQNLAVVEVALVPELPEPGNRNESHEDKAPFGATGTPTGTPPGCGAPPAPGARTCDQRKVSRLFVAAVLPVLYGRKYWTSAEKGRIEAQAARLFLGVKEDKVNLVIGNYHLRCEMAARHYEGFTGAPLPHPEQFFNPDIAAGFVLTRNWPQYPEKFPVTRHQAPPKLKLDGQRSGQIALGGLLPGFLIQ
jgi:hypothetical protein